MSTQNTQKNDNKRKVYVVGVGMTKFEKPGKQSWDYPDMGEQAAKRALGDAGLEYNKVEQVVVGYVYGDSTAGQRAIYNVGLTGVPIYNVNNNCSTGSSALFLAKQLIEGGISDCVLALGFEKMERGSLGAKFMDRVNPMDRHLNTMIEARGMTEAPPAAQMFGNAGREHMDKYGTTKEQFAKIAYKNHKHSVNNPYSQFRDEYSLDQILKSPNVFDPLTKLQCCPTSDGAAAAVLVSENFVKIHKLESQAVEIAAIVMRTDYPSTFEKSCIKMVGSDMTRAAAQTAYQQAGVTPNDVQVIELHDCFSCNELLTYEALGLCKEGEGGKLIDSGNVTYGGKWVVNPSGGLISKGHPLGATGLAQCAELCWQLRGMAGVRQVKNAKVALQHNIGLGGAAVVGVYRLGFPEQWKPYPANKKNYAIDPTDSAPVPTSAPVKVELKATKMFEQLEKTIALKPELLKTVAAIFQFDITGPSGQTNTWIVDLKNAPGKVTQEKSGFSPDCTITVGDDDFVGMMSGKLSAQNLFMGGKLKIGGNMNTAMKLRELAQGPVKPRL